MYLRLSLAITEHIKTMKDSAMKTYELFTLMVYSKYPGTKV